MVSIISRIKKDFSKSMIWFICGISTVLLISLSIASTKLFYLSGIFIPFLIYLCLKHPFIFPLGAYVFLLPFDSVLAITGSKGATLTKLLGILTMLVLLLKGFIEKKFKTLNKAAIYWIFFIIYCLLSIIWANEPDIVRSRYLTAIGLLFLYLIVSSYKIHRDDYNIIKYCILAGGFFASLITIYEFVAYGNIVYGTKDYIRTSLIIGERISEINRFVFHLLLPVTICIQILLDQKRKLLKIILLCVLGIIIICIILSGSRGGLLSAGVIFIVYFLFSKKKMTIWTTFICIGIIFVSLAPTFIFPRLEDAGDTGGSGRLTIWSTGLSAIKKYWILGAGLDNFVNVYSEFGYFTPFSLHIYRAPHNIYLGALIELGIIGFSLLIWVILKHYQIIKSLHMRGDINVVMLKGAFWAVLASSFFLGTLWIKSFWLLWMLIMMYKNVVEEEKMKFNPTLFSNSQ